MPHILFSFLQAKYWLESLQCEPYATEPYKDDSVRYRLQYSTEAYHEAIVDENKVSLYANTHRA